MRAGAKLGQKMVVEGAEALKGRHRCLRAGAKLGQKMDKRASHEQYGG